MLRFGLPLIASALFGWLATFGDRWLLARFFGADEAGLYAAGYDLQMNLLGVPMTVMQLAGVPLTVGALTERGAQAAQEQLRLLGVFIILIVLPEAVGIVMTGTAAGEYFSRRGISAAHAVAAADTGRRDLPQIAHALRKLRLFPRRAHGSDAAVAGRRRGHRYRAQSHPDPAMGPGARPSAALVGFGAGLAIAAMMMPRVFRFPLPDPALFAAGLIGAAAMAAWLWPFHHMTEWSSALYVIPIAILIYFGAVFLFLHFTGRKPLDLVRGLWNGTV